MKKPITGGDVLRQLKADLIGKDSYRGVTLTYTWLANQFGHFSLGYIPTLLVYSIFIRCFSIHCPAFMSALTVSTIWLLFEVYNFLGPLLLNRHSQSNLVFITDGKYVFQPAWANIAFDTFTDVCFFCFGAFSASLFLYFSRPVVYILICLIVLLIYPCRYWFLTKMFLQLAAYPFQFRLSQWNCDISETDKKTVLDFVSNRMSKKHLFIFGGLNSGKTSLSVGIATERSIKHETCTYTTGMKLYSMFFASDDKLLSDTKTLWTWRDASLLVIDDINPGNPVKHDLVTPDRFLKMLDTNDSPNVENRETIRTKNVIWVMGNESKIFYTNWRAMLQSIGVEHDDIHAVTL